MVALAPGEQYQVTGQGYSGEGKVTDEQNQKPSGAAEQRLKELAKAGIICNEGRLKQAGEQWEHSGDAVDVALLAFGYKMGYDPNEIKKEINVAGEIPFESERRYAAVFIEKRVELR
ncbi:hypothetical protein N752_21695 [Desulforamulus aquiferis]|nr:hypothetical protein [Desulforamulus aquiferis]RYD03027.1 hypothetical protein N752_21695 [Desulforamulus aquiferis]